MFEALGLTSRPAFHPAGYPAGACVSLCCIALLARAKGAPPGVEGAEGLPGRRCSDM